MAHFREVSLLLFGGLFLRPFTFAGPLLPFVGESGLPLRRLVDWPGGNLLRLVACLLAAGVRRSTLAAQIAGQFGMLAERSVGSDGTPENEARLRHGRGDDVRIVALLRRTPVKEIAVC